MVPDQVMPGGVGGSVKKGSRSIGRESLRGWSWQGFDHFADVRPLGRMLGNA